MNVCNKCRKNTPTVELIKASLNPAQRQVAGMAGLPPKLELCAFCESQFDQWVHAVGPANEGELRIKREGDAMRERGR